jgi:cellobiose-specific phosphotransferase system component IIB
MAFTIVTQGTFTQPATAVNQTIPLPSSVDYFKTYNLTQMATTQSTGRNVIGEWFGGGLTNNNDGISWVKANSANTMTASTFATLGASGFTYVNKYPAPQAALTGTTITQATAAVASVTNTYSNGDQVVIYNAVGMQQISGMTFTISSVTGSQFTLLGLNSSGFAAAATSFMVRRVAAYALVEPQALFVTAITQAAQAQVTVSQANMVYLGQKLEFTIPASFGMVQLNNFYISQNLPVVVTAIVDPYNFLINVNTTNFTAFAFPASSGSPTTQFFATVAPAGQSTQYNPITGVQTGYNFNQIPFHTGLFTPYMLLPAGAQAPGGSANDVIVWQAYKMETGTINAPVPS